MARVPTNKKHVGDVDTGASLQRDGSYPVAISTFFIPKTFASKRRNDAWVSASDEDLHEREKERRGPKTKRWERWIDGSRIAPLLGAMAMTPSFDQRAKRRERCAREDEHERDTYGPDVEADERRGHRSIAPLLQRDGFYWVATSAFFIRRRRSRKRLALAKNERGKERRVSERVGARPGSAPLAALTSKRTHGAGPKENQQSDDDFRRRDFRRRLPRVSESLRGWRMRAMNDAWARVRRRKVFRSGTCAASATRGNVGGREIRV